VTHEELLEAIDFLPLDGLHAWMQPALRAVVKYHEPSKIPDWVPTKNEYMCWCAHVYPCPTIQAIEKELA
jgi:hypothetical protein